MSHQWSEIDNLCMDRALECAQRGELHVAPNPLVGCVIVDEDDVVIVRGGIGHSANPMPKFKRTRVLTPKTSLDSTSPPGT